MSGSTGQSCPKSGVWRSQGSCHQVEIALSVNETFPPCRHCKRAVTWVLVRPTQN